MSTRADRGYTIADRDQALDFMADYPAYGEQRWYSDALGTEQVSFSWRHMPPGTGGRGSYESTEDVQFVDLDLNGNVVAHGSAVTRNWSSADLRVQGNYARGNFNRYDCFNRGWYDHHPNAWWGGYAAGVWAEATVSNDSAAAAITTAVTVRIGVHPERLILTARDSRLTTFDGRCPTFTTGHSPGIPSPWNRDSTRSLRQSPARGPTRSE